MVPASQVIKTECLKHVIEQYLAHSKHYISVTIITTIIIIKFCLNLQQNQFTFFPILYLDEELLLWNDINNELKNWDKKTHFSNISYMAQMAASTHIWHFEFFTPAYIYLSYFLNCMIYRCINISFYQTTIDKHFLFSFPFFSFAITNIVPITTLKMQLGKILIAIFKSQIYYISIELSILNRRSWVYQQSRL